MREWTRGRWLTRPYLENALESYDFLADIAGHGLLGAGTYVAERDDVVLREALLVVAKRQPISADLDVQRRRNARLVPVVVAVLHQLPHEQQGLFAIPNLNQVQLATASSCQDTHIAAATHLKNEMDFFGIEFGCQPLYRFVNHSKGGRCGPPQARRRCGPSCTRALCLGGSRPLPPLKLAWKQ